MNIDTIYVDDSIIILNKPSNLLSVPGKGPDKQDCLASRVQRYYPEATVVHRLDCETSGIMMMALNKTSHRHLHHQFEKRQIHKSYHAVVYGNLPWQYGAIDIPIRLDIANRPYQIVDFIQGKPSLTYWQVIQYRKQTSYIKLTPVTGRSHQLRLHLQYLGYPILGDSLYATQAIRQLSERLLLHASHITLHHPVTEKKVSFFSHIPF